MRWSAGYNTIPSSAIRDINEANSTLLADSPQLHLFTLPQQIAFTVILAVLIVIFLIIDVYLIVRRKTDVGRKKFTIYRAMCNLGALFYALDQFGPIWAGTEYFSLLKYRWTWVFYFLGYPSMYVPILLRSWRIVCIYKRTLNLRTCKLTDLMRRQTRGDKWFLIRYFILLMPFVVLFPFVFLSTAVDYAVLPLQFCYILVFVSLSIVHLTLRRELKKYDIDESNMLLFLGLSLIIFWGTDIFLWYYVIKVASLKLGIIGYVVAKLTIGAICVVHPLIALLLQDLGCCRSMKKDGKKKDDDDEEEAPPDDNEPKNATVITVSEDPTLLQQQVDLSSSSKQAGSCASVDSRAIMYPSIPKTSAATKTTVATTLHGGEISSSNNRGERPTAQGAQQQ